MSVAPPVQRPVGRHCESAATATVAEAAFRFCFPPPPLPRPCAAVSRGLLCQRAKKKAKKKKKTGEDEYCAHRVCLVCVCVCVGVSITTTCSIVWANFWGMVPFLFCPNDDDGRSSPPSGRVESESRSRPAARERFVLFCELEAEMILKKPKQKKKTTENRPAKQSPTNPKQEKKGPRAPKSAPRCKEQPIIRSG